MTVSVAIATYNGGKYISEQLRSISEQTYPVSEIVICDDRSTDDTAEQVEQFANSSNIPVRFYVNDKNLGVVRNFAAAILKCSSELIALSDQDDFWLPEKIQKQVSFLENNPDKEVVFSDLYIVDDQLEKTGKTMWQTLFFGDDRKKSWQSGKSLNILIENGNVVTGSTIVMRSAFLPEILPLLSDNTFGKFRIHDEVISLIAAKKNVMGFVDEPLSLYRQHSSQVVGTSGLENSLFQKIRNLRYNDISEGICTYKNALENDFKTLKELNFPVSTLDFQAKKLLHYDKRCKRQKIMLLSELLNGNYAKFSGGISSYLSDIFRK